MKGGWEIDQVTFKVAVWCAMNALQVCGGSLSKIQLLLGACEPPPHQHGGVISGLLKALSWLILECHEFLEWGQWAADLLGADLLFSLLQLKQN